MPKVQLKMLGKQTTYKLEVVVADEKGNPTKEPLSAEQRRKLAEAILDYIDNHPGGEETTG